MNPEITIIPLKVPCYLLKAGGCFILIDTGDASDWARLEKALNQAFVTSENLQLVLLTHGDFDHAGNATYLHKKYGVKIAMHPADAGMVEHADQSWGRKSRSDRQTFFGQVIRVISPLFASAVKFPPFTPDMLVEDGFDLAAYGFDARILHLPGHSSGSIGILTASGNLFCGDLLMNMIKPDLHFMIDDLADCQASIARLKTLRINTVYPGHGKPFPLALFTQDNR